jgi:hypothetical protein
MIHERIRDEKYKKIAQLNSKIDNIKLKNSSIVIESFESFKNKELVSLKTEIDNLKKELSEIDEIRKSLLVFISEDIFDFLLTELKSFGLIDQIKDSARYRGFDAFRAHEVSRLGKSFYSFITSNTD